MHSTCTFSCMCNWETKRTSWVGSATSISKGIEATEESLPSHQVRAELYTGGALYSIVCMEQMQKATKPTIVDQRYHRLTGVTGGSFIFLCIPETLQIASLRMKGSNWATTQRQISTLHPGEESGNGHLKEWSPPQLFPGSTKFASLRQCKMEAPAGITTGRPMIWCSGWCGHSTRCWHLQSYDAPQPVVRPSRIPYSTSNPIWQGSNGCSWSWTWQ